jgi:hypothetical protein
VKKPNCWERLTNSVASIRPARKCCRTSAVAVSSGGWVLVNERVVMGEAIPLVLMAMKETALSWVMVTVAPSVQATPSREWKSRAVGSEVRAVTSRLAVNGLSGSAMVVVTAGTPTQ